MHTLANHIRNELIRLALPYTTDGLITTELKALALDILAVTDDEQNTVMQDEQARNVAYVNGGTP